MSVESSASNQPIQRGCLALFAGVLLASASASVSTAHAQPEVRVTVSAPAVAAPVAPPPAATVVVAPPGVVAAPPVVAAPVTPEGQWAYTRQYGWLYMPYAQNYTYVPAAGAPSMFVYHPARGWRWVPSPWVVGVGPVPYWGPHGYARFAWYSRPWFARPARWHHRHHVYVR